jgi:hypothetical protein
MEEVDKQRVSDIWAMQNMFVGAVVSKYFALSLP